MPIATCPQCRNPLEIPNELFGGPVRCADCLTVFTPSVPTVATRATPPAATREPHRSFDEPQLLDGEDRPRSRAWLWVLMFGFAMMTFACCGSCAGIYGYMIKPVMVPYTSDDKQFTASFPGVPGELFVNRKDTKGIEAVRDFPEEHYFIEYTELSGERRREDPIKVANEALDDWIKSLGTGQFIQRSKVDHKGLPAMKVLGQLDLFTGRLKGFVVLRAIKDGDRVYIVGVSGSVTESDQRVVQFFDDFTPKGALSKNDRDEQKPKGENDRKPTDEGTDKKNSSKDD